MQSGPRTRSAQRHARGSAAFIQKRGARAAAFRRAGAPCPYAVTAAASYLIPFDLVGRHIQRKAGAVALVNNGALRLVGVVHNAVLAVLHIGVYLHVEITAEPFVQAFFVVGAPQDAAV